MRRIQSIYLAGPDLWFPDAADVLMRKKALCTAAGFTGVLGGGDGSGDGPGAEVMAREVYATSLERLRAADAVVANLSPWRGPGCDPGTAFEAGFAAALGKPVFAYMNVEGEDEADHRTRVEMLLGAAPDAMGRWRDDLGATIEDYGLPENLLLWAEARRFYVIVTPDPLEDLTGLELCLEAVRLYSD